MKLSQTAKQVIVVAVVSFICVTAQAQVNSDLSAKVYSKMQIFYGVISGLSAVGVMAAASFVGYTMMYDKSAKITDFKNVIFGGTALGLVSAIAYSLI